MRKQPKQARSRHLVDCILQTYEAMRERRERCSVLELAEAAGVGVGSVYDYFTDLDDIETAVIERRCVATFDAIANAVADTTTAPRALATFLTRICSCLDGWCHSSDALRRTVARAMQREGFVAARRRLQGVLAERLDCTPQQAEQLGERVVKRIRAELRALGPSPAALQTTVRRDVLSGCSPDRGPLRGSHRS